MVVPVDRRIPLTLIAAILLQTGMAIWWASNVEARVEDLEEHSNKQEEICDKVLKMETQLEHVYYSIDEIKLLIREE